MDVEDQPRCVGLNFFPEEFADVERRRPRMTAGVAGKVELQIGLWVRLLRIPGSVLYPSILVLSCIGIYSVNHAVADVLLAAAFGVAGYFSVRAGFPPAPLLIGFVLGPMLEENLVRSMITGTKRGSAAEAIAGPRRLVALLLVVAIVAAWAPALAGRGERGSRGKRVAAAEVQRESGGARAPVRLRD